MKRSLSVVDFYEREVLPALFASLPSAFPEFGWVRDSRGWKSTERGQSTGEARPDRVVCHEPFGFLVHGQGPTSWLAYVNGGTFPSGRDYVEKVRALAKLAGVDASPLDRPLSQEDLDKLEKSQRKAGTLEAFLAYSKAALLGDKGKAARAYLAGRGFEESNLEDLELGLYPSQGDVSQALRGSHNPEEAGLLDARWEGRIVGAMRDRFGHLRTFFARDITGKAEPKYLYLKDAEKPAAFGLDAALREKASRENLVLVEGVLDALLLRVCCFPSVAAIGGNSVSTATLEDLAAAGVRRVTLALDYDSGEKGFPGLEGSRRAVENATKGSNVPVVYVLHPEELHRAAGTAKGEKVDPDSLVRSKGFRAFQEALTKAEPGRVFLVRDELGDVTPKSQDRREVAERALGLLASYRGEAALDREDALRLVAERTGYGLEALLEVEEEARGKREREERNRNVLHELEDARRRVAAGEDAAALARGLGDRLARLSLSTVEAPPAFSVSRLEAETRNIPPGRSSGWEALDRIEVKFHPAELTLVAAQPRHGKTSFLVGLLAKWLKDAAANNEERLFVLYSAEEPEVRIFHRLLSLGTAKPDKWDANEIRDYLRDPFSRGERYGWPLPQALQKAKDALSRWEPRLLVVHRPRWNVDELAAHARSLSEARPIGGVLVDFLQRIPGPEGSYDRRDIEVSQTARRLKELAEVVAAPVVAGAQTNREAPKGQDREKIQAKNFEDACEEIRKGRPALHHLREGGSEQEADTVLGLLNCRADYHTEEDGRKGSHVPPVTPLDVGTLKNRYGDTGKWAELAFEARYHEIRDKDL